MSAENDLGGKAVEEIGKTARAYRREVRELGAFLGRIIGRPAEETSGLFGDLVRYARIELAIRFHGRVDRLLKEQGSETINQIPMAIAVPILESASLEEDEALQELWAQLLANAVNPISGIRVERSYVQLLRALSPLDVKILAAIVDAPEDAKDKDGFIETSLLPDEYVLQPNEKGIRGNAPPDIAASVWNLVGNALVIAANFWDSGDSIELVRLSPLGERLVVAARPPKR